MNEYKCPNCNEKMSEWEYIRFAGLGIWKDKNEYGGCKKCNLRFDGSKIPEIPEYKHEIMIQSDNENNRMQKQRREHTKDLVQPFRGDTPSKEFQEIYPRQAKEIFKNTNKKPEYVFGKNGSLNDLK